MWKAEGQSNILGNEMLCKGKERSQQKGNQNWLAWAKDDLQVIGVNGGGDLEQSLDGAKFQNLIIKTSLVPGVVKTTT